MYSEEPCRTCKDNVSGFSSAYLIHMLHGVYGYQFVYVGIIIIGRRIRLSFPSVSLYRTGELSRGRIVEHILINNVIAFVHREHYYLGCAYRTSSDVEKAVRRTHLLKTENGCILRTDLLLKRCHGLNVFPVLFPSFRFRERALVDLLVLVQRNAFDLHDSCRYHVGRFFLFDEALKHLTVNGRIRYDIGRDVFSSKCFIIKGLDGHITDARILTYNAFYFGKLDTETAHLDLPVVSSDKIDAAVLKPPYYIAGPVDSVKSRFITERIWDKGIFCLLRLI